MSPRRPTIKPALDSAVRKVEKREQSQDKRKGKAAKPVRSTGRTIRDGWREGA